MKIGSSDPGDRTTAVGMICQSADGSIQSCNREAERILGYTAEKMTTAIPRSLSSSTVSPENAPSPIHPALAFFYSKSVATALEGVASFDTEMQFYRPDGTSIWLLLNSQPLFSGNRERPSAIVTTFRDLTLTNSDSAKLQVENEFKNEFKIFADAVPGILYVFDTISQRNIYINSQSYDSLGYTSEQIVSMGEEFTSQIMHPEDFAKFPAHLLRLERSQPGEVIKLKYRMRHRSGEWRWFSTQDRVYSRTAEGKAEQILGVARDISQRQQAEIDLKESEARLKLATTLDIDDLKQTEAALRHSQQELELITAVVPQQIWTAATDGHIDYINQRWQDYTGLNLAQMRRRGWSAIVHPDDLSNTKISWIQAIKTEEKFDLEVRLRSADGNYHWFLSKARPLRNEQGKIIKWYGTNTSITRIKELEEKLLQQTQDLTNANLLKDEFLAIVSHELRTPLNPILGWSQLLATGLLDESKTAMGIEIIGRNATAQAKLIDDLLDVSKILRDKLNLNKTTLNLESVIKSALTTIQWSAEVKSIQIETEFEPTVGNVSGDAVRLQQVVWNLVSNAIKFTAEAGQIFIKLKKVGSQAQIVVRDTGQGIDPKFLPYVFDRFSQQESSSTRHHGGLGLGLAIVRHLTELHGGTASVSSPGLGQGTTFCINLPLMNTSSMNSTNITPVDNLVQPNRFSGVNILVVDDEVDSLDILTMILEQEGAEVISVGSAQEALEVFNQTTPGLIISDIGMPHTDGYDLIDRIRALPQGKDIPAIALTAYAGEVDRQHSLAAGFQQHLAKPINIPELIATITKFLE